MLVLTRKAKEEIRIGNDITVTIVRVKGQSVRIGINAPDHVHIMRSELANQGTTEQSLSKKPKTASNVPPKGEPISQLRGNKLTAADLAANSPMMKRLENQLNPRPNTDASHKSSQPTVRFQSSLGATDSFSRVLGQSRLDRTQRTQQANDDTDNR